MRVLDTVCYGALVADAAAMGFHWMYDQEKIRRLGGDAPEFYDPTASSSAYTRSAELESTFVHHGKKPGDLTQYGEQLMVIIKALAKTGGRLDQAEYEKEFKSFFGPGGPWVGYIDRPTGRVLFNHDKRNRDAYARARSFDNGLTEGEKDVLDDEVRVCFKFYDDSKSTEENLEVLDGWVLRKSDFNRDPEKDRQKIEYCRNMFFTVRDCEKELCGDVGDDQFPAIAKLPPVVALYRDSGDYDSMVELAVRVTNHNDKAVAYAQVYADMLRAAIAHRDKAAILDAARRRASGNAEITGLIDAAIERLDRPNTEVGKFFGPSCHMPYGLPQTMHRILNCESYVHGVRMNIAVGGDNAGRSIMDGAILAALYGVGTENGVPMDWIARLTKRDEIDVLLESLPDA
ncbi:MAG: ADP-ribosylglycohydrolase family protein [Rhodobacteraceae bacterium]|nr:ADP-ribosylglycohydrolase family protein [Paracoccaceae bacterium]